MLTFFAGCQEEEIPALVKEDKISVAPESKNFTNKGGSVDVIVTSSGEWTLEGEYEWVTVSAIEGVDGDAVKFEVEENKLEQELKAEYTFVCGRESASFIITCEKGEPEKPAETISLFPESLEPFSHAGGKQSVMVTSSAGWLLDPDGDYDWVTPSALSGEDGDQVDFTVSANTGTEQRTASFTFTVGETTLPLEIIQEGISYSMELKSDKEVSVLQTGGDITVILGVQSMTNRDIRTEIPSEASSWLSLTTTLQGDNADEVKVVLNAAENTEYEGRSAVVKITGLGDTSVEVNVSQAQKDRLETSSDLIVYVPLEGGNIEIPIIANVDYTVTPSDSWIEHTGKTGDNECFNIPSTGSERTGAIEFKGGSITLTITVQQEEQALIEHVAYMYENWAWPAWTNPSPVTNMSTFTLEAYINPDFYNMLDISTIMGIEGNFLIRFGNGQGVSYSTLQVVYDGGEMTVKNFVPLFEGNKWFHLAVTFDKGKIAAYINGIQAATATSRSSYVNFGVTHEGDEIDGPYGRRFFWVGYSYDESRTFNGRLSEVRIWNKALSSDEINSPNHFYYVDPSSEGLVAYWKFNEESGAMTIKDWSQYGNDMQLETALTSERVSLPAEE